MEVYDELARLRLHAAETAMRAVVVTEPGKVAMVELAPPHRRALSGPGADRGRVSVQRHRWQADRGPFSRREKYPLVLGHECAGIVEAVGDKVRNFRSAASHRRAGLRFLRSGYSSGWGGFCEYTLANDHDAMVADGVADAEHGWSRCYEIQRPRRWTFRSRRRC